MYGTIARLKLKPGMGEAMRAESEGYKDLKIDGFVATAVYRADAGDDEYWMAVIFENREKYHANANSAEQDARFQKMREMLAAEPEWHDGEVIARNVAD